MVRPSATFPVRMALKIGDRLVPAVPVELSGQQAAVLLGHDVETERPMRLLLAWEAGGTTEIVASVREHGHDGGPTRLDLHDVSGDWKPFLEWLGSQTGD